MLYAQLTLYIYIPLLSIYLCVRFVFGLGAKLDLLFEQLKYT